MSGQTSVERVGHSPAPFFPMDEAPLAIVDSRGKKIGSAMSRIELIRGKPERLPYKEEIANRNLFIAAPDLLQAAKEVLDHVENMELDRGGTNQCTLCWTYRMKLHDAVRKAEGRS